MKKLLVFLLLVPFLGFSQTITSGRYIVTSGSTDTIANDAAIVMVNPSSIIASHVMTLPLNPSDFQVVKIFFGGTITNGNPVVSSLSVVAGQGQTILQGSPISTAYSGDYLVYTWIVSTQQWRKTSGVMQATLKGFISYSNMVYNSTPSVILSSPIVLSTTNNTRVNYTVSVSSSVSVGQAIAYLQISSDGTIWKTICQAGETSVALLNTKYYNLQGEVPIGYYRRILTSTSGGASMVYICGQEITY